MSNLKKFADQLVQIEKDKHAVTARNPLATPSMRRGADQLLQIEKDKRAAALRAPKARR